MNCGENGIIPKEHMYVSNRSDAARTRLLVKAVPDELTVFTGEVQLSQILTLNTFNQLQRNLKTTQTSLSCIAYIVKNTVKKYRNVFLAHCCISAACGPDM